jgi:hypothetical protein
MDNFSEHLLGADCLLRLELGTDELVQRLVGVAEAAEHKGARWPVHILQEYAECALRDGPVGLGRDCGDNVEGIRERTMLV